MNGLKTLARGLKLGTPLPPQAFADPKIPDDQIEATVKAVEDQELVVAKVIGELTTQRGILEQKVQTLEDVVIQVAWGHLACVAVKRKGRRIDSPAFGTLLQESYSGAPVSFQWLASRK